MMLRRAGSTRRCRLLGLVPTVAWLAACGDPTVVIGRDEQDVFGPNSTETCPSQMGACDDSGAPEPIDDDCREGADCEPPPNTPCGEDTCVPCQSDTDCEDDQVCDPESGVCIPVDLG